MISFKRFLLEHSNSYKYALSEIERLKNIAKANQAQIFIEHIPLLRTVLSNFGDEKSRIAFVNEIMHIVLGESGMELSQCLNLTMRDEELSARLRTVNPDDYPSIEYSPEWGFSPETAGMAFLYPQYEYEDKVCVKPGGVFLDCGACAGEVSVWANERVGSRGAVYAFEPSERVFSLLKKNLVRFAPQVHAYQFALGKERGTCAFSEDNAPWSRRAQGASFLVNEESIDAFCKEVGVKPTFIKMDIEGAECDALKGAAETIRCYEPDLAICVYHKPEDMYLVGNIILDICNKYTFYFKKHHPQWEGVLYATVNK